MSENGASGADLERFARQAVDAAVAAGADQADAWCEDGVNRTIRVYDANVESLVEAGSRGVGVRAFRDGRTGYAYGSDFGEEALRSLGEAACGSAAVTDSDEHAGIPEETGAADAGDLTASGFGAWTMERRVDLALAIERAARSRDKLISNVEDTVYSDSIDRVALANSAGFASSYERTQAYAYAYAFAGEGRDRMTGLGRRRRARAGRPRRGADRPRGCGPRPRAARGAPAHQPPLPGRARSLCRSKLRVTDRPHALGRRSAARALAVRRQGRRADRLRAPRAGRRRARSRRPRHRAVRRRGRAAAADSADRRRCAADVPVTTPTPPGGPGGPRPATESEAPTARRPRSMRPICS